MQAELRDALARIRELPADGADGPSGPALVGALRGSGLLARAGQLAHWPEDPAELLTILWAVGAENLSAGRLLEGHVNAVKLVRIYGDGASVARDLDQGLLFGVWGADGADPARIEGDTLRGAKLFASGADTVDRPVISVRMGDRPQLLLLRRDVLQGRLFPEEWQVSGMQATASGRCDLDGIALHMAEPLGQPGDYLTEPHFQGGVWRYAAVQAGAMGTLLRITADHLRTRGQDQAPLQAQRLRRMLTACETARLWVERAARAVEHPAAPPETADTAILARLIVADEAEALLTAMDQALGAASFARSHPADRMRRDLRFYLRQANPDGLSHSVMERILCDSQRRAAWGM
ncbi:acyl-CoA dehydrogenase family protein [Falsirhodobacter algicola]|uniref:Acyl-CoA dehydrogenase/oxidase C-terminal domain-containing protein n=1 Tax=Falsirhodobacter algicola TaxID=2692330 RepID=A0A8J8SL54_9RHOB|nr:acyl-CoA dehydrogenase family protein [Falsirhodobacter algicola]QUS36133.1 hypothetical protein GR316_07535 [Falsirhodobacter algicola]